MTANGDADYPGERATSAQVLRLADEFRAGATLLLASCRRGEPLSQSPFRLAALQAIELYLNAVLLAHGRGAVEVRALQHDLARRIELLREVGMGLRTKTAAHVARLGADREYLLARYCAERRAPPPVNRLAATLAAVARKSRASIETASMRDQRGARAACGAGEVASKVPARRTTRPAADGATLPLLTKERSA